MLSRRQVTSSQSRLRARSFRPVVIGCLVLALAFGTGRSEPILPGLSTLEPPLVSEARMPPLNGAADVPPRFPDDELDCVRGPRPFVCIVRSGRGDTIPGYDFKLAPDPRGAGSGRTADISPDPRPEVFLITLSVGAEAGSFAKGVLMDETLDGVPGSSVRPPARDAEAQAPILDAPSPFAFAVTLDTPALDEPRPVAPAPTGRAPDPEPLAVIVPPPPPELGLWTVTVRPRKRGDRHHRRETSNRPWGSWYS